MFNFKIFNLFIIIYLIKCDTISCNEDNYAGESKKVLQVLKDLQSDATHAHSHHFIPHHSGLGPVSHEGHGSGHDHWDNFDKIWENGGGSHHSDYDKYGNHGYKQRYLDIHNGYHDRHNDGLHSGNLEEHNDKSLWSRDRGHENQRNLEWDRELAINKAHSGKSGHLAKYHNVDNGAHYGNKQFDESHFDNYGGRGRHSGHGWHELDRVKHMNGAYNHGSGYRETKQPYYPPLHAYH